MENILQYNKNDFKIIKSQTPYAGFYQVKNFEIQHRLFEGGWTDVFKRELLQRPDAVGILLYDADKDKVVLIEQFRVGAIIDEKTPWMLEIVAGMVENNENHEKLAIREAKEEANCDVLDLIPVCRYYSSPGASTERVSVFCGKINNSENVSGVYGLTNEHENIRVHVVDRSYAYSLIAKGTIINALAIIALQWLELHHEAVREKWAE